MFRKKTIAVNSALMIKQEIAELESLVSNFLSRNNDQSTIVLTESKANAIKQLIELSSKDFLTGLNNVRSFHQRLVEEVGKSYRYNKWPLTLMMIDVDYFKSFNDNYGHQFGDEVLQKIASKLVDCSREHCDIVYRYGGDEFAIILQRTDQHTATTVAHRLLENIRNLDLAVDNSAISASLSIGIAEFNREQLIANGFSEIEAKDHFLKSADSMLYQAKRTRDTYFSEGLIDNQEQNITEPILADSLFR